MDGWWWVGEALLDHLVLIVGYVSRQAAGQEDPDELEHNRHKNTSVRNKEEDISFSATLKRCT